MPISTTPMSLSYYWGARGNFLYGFLINKLPEISQQKDEIHLLGRDKSAQHIDTDKMTNKDFLENITIRIQPSNDIDLLYISHYHRCKHDPKNLELNKKIQNRLVTNQFDLTFINMKLIYLDSLQAELEKSKYTYWVSFASLFDIGFLRSFYYKINGEWPNDDNIEKAKYNISIQKPINDVNYFKLLALFTFERSNNLLDTPKKFSVDEYLFSNVAHKYLHINNYFINRYE